MSRVGQRGFILIPLAACAVILLFLLNAFVLLVSHRIGAAAGLSAQFSATETARSGFIFLEAALKRRMWEVPPDGDCMRSQTFSVSGENRAGVTYSVTADFDPTTKILSMTSTANFMGVVVSLQKNSKILDASEFLLYSNGPGGIILDGPEANTNDKFASSLVGGPRKIYVEGRLQVRGHIRRRWFQNDTWASWDAAPDSPFSLHKHINFVLQAERILALGGLSYYVNTWTMRPALGNPGSYDGFINGILGPYSPSHWALQSAPNLFITGSRTEAESVLADIKTETAINPSLKARIYPRLLFGRSGSRPFFAQMGTDDGQYHNNPDQWAVFTYLSLGGLRNWTDFTCYEDITLPFPTRKSCSFSKSFPLGFSQWRADAGLNGVVLSSEATPYDFPKINWDNMEALEEEARECGHVVTASDSGSYDNSHEDCDISDVNMLHRYAASPGTNPCWTVHDLDLDNLDSRLANFDATAYDGADTTRFLRRVVYLKDRTQISQDQAEGIWPTLASANARRQLPIWIVAERGLIAKPFQPDLTSPLDTPMGHPDSARRRQSYFNTDATGVLSPLSMVILSPDSMDVVTATHVPRTFAQLQEIFPVVSGLIKPVRHVLTDYVTQENDGFKYGMRSVTLSNIALITNTKAGQTTAGLSFVGLWGPSWDEYPDVTRSCMMDDPTDAVGMPANHNGYWPNSPAIDRVLQRRGEYPIPAYARATSASPGPHWVPPRDSKFWVDQHRLDVDAGVAPAPVGTLVGIGAQPYSVVHQVRSGMSVVSSEVLFRGLRFSVVFDDSTPGGRRNLNETLYSRTDAVRDYAEHDSLFDLSGRKFVWDGNYFAGVWRDDIFKRRPDGTSGFDLPCPFGPSCNGTWANVSQECLRGTPILANSSPNMPYVANIFVDLNRGRIDFFSHLSPDSSFGNVGAVANTALPSTYVSP